ncbi:MAG: hypothetical protein JW772_01840 [Candidatus Diapherotrites archaeon]|nr:hypothetical protein [Candidatus Diapherotrites archaeon]
MNKNNSGQAGLEYLMTYGWALILIVAVASVLFFVMAPSTSEAAFTSSDPTKIVVKSGNIDSSGNVEIKAQNATGGQIRVAFIQFAGDLQGSQLNGVERSTINMGNPLTVPSGGEMNFTGMHTNPTGSIDGSLTIYYWDQFNYMKLVGLNMERGGGDGSESCTTEGAVCSGGGGTNNGVCISGTCRYCGDWIVTNNPPLYYEQCDPPDQIMDNPYGVGVCMEYYGRCGGYATCNSTCDGFINTCDPGIRGVDCPE